MQVFSGSTSNRLAKRIAKSLGVTLGTVELSAFPNGECRVWVTEKKIDPEVLIVQSFAGDPNQAIVEFCLFVDAIRRMKTKTITAVIPWMGYCIQDKIFRYGEPLSARVVVDIIESTKVDKVITIDLHNESIEGFFNIPVVQLSASDIFVDFFKKHNSLDVVVSPDVGAMKETTKVAEALNLPMTVINKKRDLRTGKVEIVSVEGKIAKMQALILDDFVSTGSTLVQTAQYLKKKKVKKVKVAVTHFLNVPGVLEKLAYSGIDELVITDTVELSQADLKKYGHKNFKITVLSMAEMIAKEIRS